MSFSKEFNNSFLSVFDAFDRPTESKEFVNIPIDFDHLMDSSLKPLTSADSTQEFQAKMKERLSCVDQAIQKDSHQSLMQCVGKKYKLIKKDISHTLYEKEKQLFKDFSAGLNAACKSQSIPDCYEIETAVNLAIMHRQNPERNLAKIYPIDKLPPNSDLKILFDNLKSNYSVCLQLKTNCITQARKTVESIISTLSESNLKKLNAFVKNPFEKTKKLKKPNARFDKTDQNVQFLGKQTIHSGGVEKMDSKSPLPAQNSNKLIEETKSHDIIPSLMLSDQSPYPVPTVDQLKELGVDVGDDMIQMLTKNQITLKKQERII